MGRDAVSLLDMLKAARKVVEYATGLDKSGFIDNSRDQDAILRQLTIVIVQGDVPALIDMIEPLVPPENP